MLGAIDGKHIRIECPILSGTLYHNYKGFFSLVLLAICVADYCFTLFDLGSYGSNNDCGVLANSPLGNALESNALILPEHEQLDGCAFHPLPYFFLGDDIFPLKTWLIKPYPGRNLTEEEKIFNYRLSRCRCVIENAFGILAARWRIFHRPIRASVEHVEQYVLVAIALHNYLRQTSNASYTPNGFVDSEDGDGTVRLGEWRRDEENRGQCMQDIRLIQGSRCLTEDIQMRDDLKSYFNSEHGRVSWQLEYVRRTYKNN